LPVDVAFITASYNTVGYVRNLANFFENLAVPFTFSFTVVDNHSTDGSQEFLKSCGSIQHIQNGENVGYGRAINQGVAATDSKYVCVTNTDVILNREALVALWQFMEEQSKAGLCAPRVTYEDGREQGLIFRRSLLAHYATWFAKMLAWYWKMKVAKAREPVRVDGVMGAFFLIRRSIIPKPALFDKDFFFFHEDTALAHTLKNAGIQCYVIPGAVIIHMRGKSGSQNSVQQFYASKYLYLTKFYGSWHARMVRFLDGARVLRKLWWYSMFSLVRASEQIKVKQRYYKMAWNAVHSKRNSGAVADPSH
jgi:N-acetylglucosaminyl-diphospho-decaprenol L-rhamnosyltransferase